MIVSRKFLFVIVALVVIAASASADEIHDAARAGDLAAVKRILKEKPNAVNAAAEDGDTPLHFATFNGHTEVIRFLIESGAEVDARNSANQSPLLYAAYLGHREIVELFLASGAEPDYRDTRENTPLNFAARQGQKSVVELLISEGVEIDPRGNQGRTPLHMAAGSGHPEIIELLAANGADINTKDGNGESPLYTALSRGHDGIVDWLMENGAVVSAEGDEAVRILHAAAASGRGDLVESLVSRGVDLTSKNMNGGTILHSAAMGGLGGLAVMAAGRAGDIDAVDNNGRTPLHYAAGGGYGEIIELLVDKGADLNIKGKDGRTPLHIAEDWGREEIIAFLVSRGADDVPRNVYRLKNRERVSGDAKGKGEAHPLMITYIANEGFLIAHGSKKVMIDALQRNPWNYISTGDEIFEMMLEARPPFDGIDLLIASHEHRDHFEPVMTSRFLLQNPGAVFVSSQLSFDALREAAGGDFDKIGDRVKNINPGWGTTAKMTYNGIGVEVFGVNHAGPGNPEFMTLASVLDLDGIRVAHLADLVPEANEENFRAAGLQENGVDIAFVDPFFLQDSIGRVVLEEYIRPGHMILMHLRPSEVDDYSREFEESYPEVIIFREPMETRRFE